MIDTKRKNISFFIIVIFILLILVILVGGLFIFNSISNLEPGNGENKIIEQDICDISLSYYVSSFLLLKNEIKLTDEETEKLNEIINNLEYSSSNDGVTSLKYYIKYCNSEFIIGDDETISRNEKNVNIVKGYDELIEFLSEQEKKINRVFLYNFDLLATEDSEYKSIDLSDEDKNQIRELWSKQDKTIEYIDLAIMSEYTLVIDDDVLDIDVNSGYVKYQDGFILLSEDIIDVLNKYIASNMNYTIDNNLSYTDSKYSERGVYYDNSNIIDTQQTFTISSGTKSSSGYSISIGNVEIDEEGNVEVIVKEEVPSSDEITLTVLTYPICRITFNKEYQNIVVKTESGEVFNHLNF